MNKKLGDVSIKNTLLQSALCDWKAAQNRFEHSSTSEMTELAIYDMQAAMHRYMFLLRDDDE